MSYIRGERQIIFLYVLTDILLLWLAFSVVTLARLNTLPQVDFLLIQRDRLICCLLFMASALFSGCYRETRITDKFDAVYYACGAIVVAMVLQLALVTLIPVELRVISRREILLGNALSMFFIGVWHLVAVDFVSRFRDLHRFFYVIGDEDPGRRIAAEIGAAPSLCADAQYIGFDVLVERLSGTGRSGQGNEEVIIAARGSMRERLHDILSYCEGHCRRTFLYPSIWDTLLFQHSSLSAIAGVPVVEIASQRRQTPYRYTKRAIDLGVSAFGLLLTLPILAVIAIAIKATSTGPVLYRQERLGMAGKPFQIYKFRSMQADVELKNEEGHVLATRDDARITPIGRFIRKHRIDEIPQLFNVLKGDMSLIGPRPVWREYYESQGQRQSLFQRRLDVRPGLTSLSHILGSYSSKPEDRLRYDLIYICNLSFLLDLKIMVSTIRIVLSGKGAQ